jgi:hypothetical protein
MTRLMKALWAALVCFLGLGLAGILLIAALTARPVSMSMLIGLVVVGGAASAGLFVMSRPDSAGSKHR